jgi:hypothetical protein
MAIQYITIFQSKAHQNLPKIGIFGLKINHLATLIFRSWFNFKKRKNRTVQFFIEISARSDGQRADEFVELDSAILKKVVPVFCYWVTFYSRIY